MKKIVLVLTLGLSATMLFSFKASTTAKEHMQDPGNYQVDESILNEFRALHKAYQEDPNVDPESIATKCMIYLNPSWTRRIWLESGRDLVYALLGSLNSGANPMTDDDIEFAEQLGILTAL